MEHTTIICTACTLSMPRYARALPASAANANPAMLETSAQSMRTAATARESQPLSRCSRIGFARSADAITVESRSAPKKIFSQGRPAEKGWPDILRGIVGKATTAPPRWLWIIGMASLVIAVCRVLRNGELGDRRDRKRFEPITLPMTPAPRGRNVRQRGDKNLAAYAVSPLR